MPCVQLLLDLTSSKTLPASSMDQSWVVQDLCAPDCSLQRGMHCLKTTRETSVHRNCFTGSSTAWQRVGREGVGVYSILTDTIILAPSLVTWPGVLKLRRIIHKIICLKYHSIRLLNATTLVCGRVAAAEAKKLFSGKNLVSYLICRTTQN